MGPGFFRWKLIGLIILALLLWQATKVLMNIAQEKSAIKAQLQDVQLVTINQEAERRQQRVHVAVYYEALCPDSRSFFIKQLLPTYHRIPENIQVELIPYGKAMTRKTDDGYRFTCQHGPVECDANMIHACSIDVLRNSSVQLEYLSCMIKNNLDPVDIMKSCASRMNIDYNSIYDCFVGDKGKELLAKYGDKTHALVPAVSFIPTVTLDGSSKNQAKILKNLLQEVCLQFQKVIPEGCIS
ncbi:gamma-interferon-inducible lysosomal thiol reductase-like [Ceratina calcarata]|uniref:Gamma-interferon-inducible lysosomal thiol reductase-like n=1 Tax=Ceratina calcarata TaxID=156304 RepID=A0AAJ7N755_9HYME|nr:gamma-interferon-inducible lysosomal thiol reductase-like [Ceratina calcarata]